jgi:hypothetical protein
LVAGRQHTHSLQHGHALQTVRIRSWAGHQHVDKIPLAIGSTTLRPIAADVECREPSGKDPSG